MPEQLLASLHEQVRGRYLQYGLAALAAALLAGFLIGTKGMVGVAAVALVPLVLAIVIVVLVEPKLGILIYVQISFIVNGIGRFVNYDAPYGTLVDALLVLTIVSVLLNGRQMHWERLRNPIFPLIGVWFAYVFLEFLNPNAPYRMAWAYQFRAVSFYWFLVTIIVLVLPFNRSDVRILVRTWLIWSLIAAVWAFKQQYIGLTDGEATWLTTVGMKTHFLNGHLRSFSFYSDAAQFGAEMAYTTLLCAIRLFEEKTWLRRLGYAVLMLLFFWGFAVSSTRGALFVLLIGFPFYLLLKRDFVKIGIGLAVAIPLFVLLKFTYIGNANYEIYRIRSAVNPDKDASFQVRVANQKRLADIMKAFPFGVGIGSSGDTGQRFAPNHFAAQIPPDSWYVRLWIETGAVGVGLYILMLLILITLATRKVWRLRDPWMIKVMYSFLAGFVGVCVMGYSNPVLGQFPTNTMIFISTVLLMTCDRLERET